MEQIIGAESGWKVVEPWTDERGKIERLEFMPVIAWALEVIPEGVMVWPVTIEGIEKSLEVFRTPGGLYFIPFDRRFDNESEAVGYLEKREKGRPCYP